MAKLIKTMKDGQRHVSAFAKKSGWGDQPNVDKFDHLHEELIEMSKLLRYKTLKQRIKLVKERKEEFEDGIGDLQFALYRLANQLGVDVEKAFNLVTRRIKDKYKDVKGEGKP